VWGVFVCVRLRGEHHARVECGNTSGHFGRGAKGHAPHQRPLFIRFRPSSSRCVTNACSSQSPGECARRSRKGLSASTAVGMCFTMARRLACIRLGTRLSVSLRFVCVSSLSALVLTGAPSSGASPSFDGRRSGLSKAGADKARPTGSAVGPSSPPAFAALTPTSGVVVAVSVCLSWVPAVVPACRASSTTAFVSNSLCECNPPTAARSVAALDVNARVFPAPSAGHFPGAAATQDQKTKPFA